MCKASAQDDVILANACGGSVVVPMLSKYEEVMEALPAQSKSSVELHDRLLATYSRLKGLSTSVPALHAVNLIIALPTVLSIALPVLISYVVFLLPALKSAVALSYFCMLAKLLRSSYKSSRSHRLSSFHAPGTVIDYKVVPVGTIVTHASHRVATAGTSTA
jgi:hypothetical protein